MVRATGADSSCIVERSVLPLIIIDGGAGRGRMRAVRADAPEEAGEERHDADPPLLEGERDVGMRGVLTGMFTKLWSQVGAGFVETVEEEETLSDEEWEQPSGGRRPNTAKHRTTWEAGGVLGAPLTPAARSSSPTAAAAAAAPSPS